MGDAVRERIDVAVGPIGLRDLAGEPVGRDRALAHEKAVERHHELGMGRRRDLAIIRNLADLPQPLDVGAGSRHRAHFVVARGMVEHQDILGDRRARQRVLRRRRRQRRLQRADRGEVEIGVAPLHDLHRLEGVRLERLRQLGARTADSARWCRRCRRAWRGRRGRRSAPVRPG